MKEAVKQALDETVTPVLVGLKLEMAGLTSTMTDRVTVVEGKVDDHEARITALESNAHTHAPTGTPPFAGEPT